MQNSKEYMKQNGIGARISFADGAEHTVKLLKDKQDSIPDGKGGTVTGMKYLVEENGEQKTIFTGSVGLIGKLSECNPNDVVSIQMYKANNKSYYRVSKDGAEVKAEDEDETVVGDDEQAPAQAGW